MADDTRQPKEDLSREALTVHPEDRPFAGTQWQDGKAQPYTPPENANMLAGGTQHTAGGKAPEVSIGNAFQSGIKLSDFTDLPKRPCVRDALMTGIGGGFALGGFRAIFGGT
jgi:cytochrome c oxidase assembly protein subunit 20